MISAPITRPVNMARVKGMCLRKFSIAFIPLSNDNIAYRFGGGEILFNVESNRYDYHLGITILDSL